MSQTATKPLAEVVEFLRRFAGETPEAAVVLGSGVKVLEQLEEERAVTYDELFGVAPGVVGHAGSLSIGRAEGRLVAVLRGRFHLYEGHDWNVVTTPTRALIEWGVPRLFLTNAAGGLNPEFNVGDLMLITGVRDHLHPELKSTGLIPRLKAPPVNCLNPLTDRIVKVAAELAREVPWFLPLRAGVYAALLGPNYETLAEIEMLRALACDAVGMSTAPELAVSRGTTTTAAALSVITNVWKPEELIGGHEEVLEAAKLASERLDCLFRAVIRSSAP